MPPTRITHLLAAPLLVVACSTQGALEACPDAACRANVVQREFNLNPARSAQTLTSLDPVEQEVLVRALAQDHEEDLSQLCEVLVVGSAGRQVCERMQQRPHLRLGTKVRSLEQGAPRKAPGPATRHAALPEVQPPDDAEMQAVLADLAPCGQVPSCASDMAVAAAREGRAQRAGAICQVGFDGDQVQQEECAFRAAEAMAQAFRWRASQQVIALCAWAGAFSHGCVQHSMVMMMPDLPAADAAGPEDITESLEALAALQEAVGPALAEDYEDLFWAMWTGLSFIRAERVDGRLLQVLPSVAWPHVRMAAAWSFLERRSLDESVDLDAWAAELGGRLADPGAAQARSLFRPEHGKEKGFWPEDLDSSGEDAIPAVFCLGPARRPVSEDPELDLELALIEASARIQHPPAVGFYLGLLESDRELVLRWTALRLLGAVEPALSRSFDRPGEPDLLRVRARQPPVK